MMTQTSLSAATRVQRDESAGSSFRPQPLVYPEARRALIHPRNPFPATSHPSLATEVLIANGDTSSIGILSDQRESKGLQLEFHLTHTKLSPLRNAKSEIFASFVLSSPIPTTSHESQVTSF